MSTSIAFDIIAKDRASAQFDKVGNSADRSSGKLKKFAKVGALAVGAAAVVAGKALFDMAKGAIADEKAQAILAKQLKNSAGATKAQVKQVEDYISAMGRQLGVTDDELRPAMGRLVAATGDVSKATSLSMIAMNVAAGTGKSLKTVTEALAKAQTGNVGGLSRLGVATKDAAGKTLSLDKITAKLAATYAGSAATAANTTEGKFNRLKVQFDETKEAIGAKLIPVAAKLADWLLTKVLPAASKLGAYLSENFGPAFSKIAGFLTEKLFPALKDLAGKWLEGVRGMFKNVGKSMEDNKPFIDQLVKGFQKLGGFLLSNVVPVLGTLYEKVFPAIGTAIGMAITVLRKLSSAWLRMAEFGVKALRAVLVAAFATFGAILTAAEKSMGWVPKLGDKIKAAKRSFDGFRSNTIANLAETAAALARTRNAIDGIKSPPPIHIKVIHDSVALGGQLGTLGPKKRAAGDGYFTGGPTWVGEYGPEIIEPPRGSRIHDAGRSASLARQGGGGSEFDYDRLASTIVRALERGTTLVRLPDAGRAAYQSGVAF